jgi:predicted TIM-barrel fold metal-dependent hydrolase
MRTGPTTVVDADSHFMEPFDWFETSFPRLHEQLPARPQHEYFLEVFLEGKLGDLHATLSPELRPTFDDIFGELGDATKIDAGALAGYTDRLVPVTLVDLSDLDWALAEIRRMRELGSRVVQVKGEPVSGRSLAHPDLEPFWATAEDLGMLVMFHVGGGRVAPNPGWVNDGRGVMDFIANYSGLAEPQMPQWALAALIKGGVLERHPRLGVVVAELGTYWVPGFAVWLDNVADDTLGTY